MITEPLGHTTPLADLRYLAHLVRDFRVRTCVEVGCYVGMSTRALVDASPEVVVHAIDHFHGSGLDDPITELIEQHTPHAVHEAFCQNLADVLFRRVFLHVGNSEQYAAVWPFSVDMVFIDANHEYEDVKRDIELWTPHVRPGGILCGHDYGVFDGVTRAVDEIKPDEIACRVWVKQLNQVQSRSGVRQTG